MRVDGLNELDASGRMPAWREDVQRLASSGARPLQGVLEFLQLEQQLSQVVPSLDQR